MQKKPKKGKNYGPHQEIMDQEISKLEDELTERKESHAKDLRKIKEVATTEITKLDDLFKKEMDKKQKLVAKNREMMCDTYDQQIDLVNKQHQKKKTTLAKLQTEADDFDNMSKALEEVKTKLPALREKLAQAKQEAQTIETNLAGLAAQHREEAKMARTILLTETEDARTEMLKVVEEALTQTTKTQTFMDQTVAKLQKTLANFRPQDAHYCGICTEPMIAGSEHHPSIPDECNHVNCNTCLLRVVSSDDPRCPKCRTDIDEIYKIYY